MTDTQSLVSAAPIIRAIDIGYGRTKYIVDDEGTYRQFPSLAPPADVHRARSSVHRDRKTVEVCVDGQLFEIGAETALFRQEPVLHEGYTETPQYRALLYGALRDMATPRIDLLVTGLPVLQHSPRAKPLQDSLRGIHTVGPGIVVDVRDVAVVVQPLGGLLAHSRERDGWGAREKRTHRGKRGRDLPGDLRRS